MPVPQNVTDDLAALDGLLTTQATDATAAQTAATNLATVTASAGKEVQTAQQAVNDANAKLSTDMTAVSDAEKKLVTDIASWVQGPTPPTPQELKTALQTFKAKKRATAPAGVKGLSIDVEKIIAAFVQFQSDHKIIPFIIAVLGAIGL